MVTVAQLLQEHVSLDIECVDRLYLNGYVPSLQTPQGLVAFLRHHLGKPVPSPVLLGRLTSSFCNEVELFIAENDIPLVQFEKRQRKDDVANAIRAERKTRPPAQTGIRLHRPVAGSGRATSAAPGIEPGWGRSRSYHNRSRVEGSGMTRNQKPEASDGRLQNLSRMLRFAIMKTA
jgi:hypothetical protein